MGASIRKRGAERSKSGNQASARRLTITQDGKPLARVACTAGFSGASSKTMSNLRKDIEHAINCNSAENGSDTPDFILAEYLTDCLAAYDRALVAREKWYGRECGGLKGPIPVDGPPPPDSENTQLGN